MKITEKDVVGFIGVTSFISVFVGTAIAIVFAGWFMALKVAVASVLVFILMLIWDELFL